MGFHPALGQMKSISLENEFEDNASAYHPMLGKMKQIDREAMGEYEEGELVGADGRVRIGDTKKVPFRWICYLELNFPDPDAPGKVLQAAGTGVLISPRHILTAGHCLFSSIKGSKGTIAKKQVISVTAYPGRSAGYYLGSATGTTFKIHGTWLASQSPRFDLGLIKLNTNIGDKVFSSLDNQALGFWGSQTKGQGTRIIPFDRAQILNNTANVAGYPGDKPAWLMWHSDKIVNTNPQAGSELIYYLMDTCAGHSGSPVWLTNTSTGNRFLIAIHTGPCIVSGSGTDCSPQAGVPCIPGRQRYSSNRGVFLTQGVINMIMDWVRTT